jgi:lysophospholipid acyltransferase (LPLAT)-like uncharacterized protein
MPGARVTAAVVGAGIVGLRATLRIETLHPEHEEALLARGAPIIYTMWHGRMVLPAFVHRHQGMVAMASRSKDGEIIARWLERNGYVPVRGSTGKGGRAALQEMVDLVRAGHRAALTIDGPKGPPRAAQIGVIQLARKTGAWILPYSSASTRPWFLNSWDRYLAPKPFSRCVVVYGEPFQVPSDMHAREALHRIGSAVDEVTREADRAVGVAPPPPWEQ